MAVEHKDGKEKSTFGCFFRVYVARTAMLDSIDAPSVFGKHPDARLDNAANKSRKFDGIEFHRHSLPDRQPVRSLPL
jgi:hypothetical protein